MTATSSLSKQEEINMLRDFADKLGGPTRSYSGPWLSSQLTALENAIRDDVPAEVYARDFREAQNLCSKIIQDGKDHAAKIVDDAQHTLTRAQEEYEKTTREAVQDREFIRQQMIDLADQIRRAQIPISAMGAILCRRHPNASARTP